MRPALYALARPLLFALDAERAHELTLQALETLAATGMLGLMAGPRVEDPVELMGLRFPNRVGLAAGMDKAGAHIDAFARLGFGFVEVGTVTPRGQPGNPRPRMFRLPAHRALVNRMGFNNAGVDAFVANVRRARRSGVLVGLNIGKNADTPLERAVDDYLWCLEKVYPDADYVTINISSPNTSKLRELQGAAALDPMLEALCATRERLATSHRRRVPLVVKIAPDLDEAQIEDIAATILRHGIDGLIATNTTTSRDGVGGARHASEAGGLSGAPLLARSNRTLVALRRHLPADYPVIGVGGICSADDALTKVAAGASLVQLCTGLVYRGPALVGECARAMAAA